jgi:hypothetical protein
MMDAKQKRIIEREIAMLFSKRALPVRPTLEEWTENPTIRTEQGDRPLSVVALAALRRVTSLIGDIPEIRNSCSPKEIAEEAFERYSSWVVSSRQPTGQEFTDDVVGALRTKIKVHELLIAIEGIDHLDQEVIDLGSIKISKADPKLLEGVEWGGMLDFDWVYGLFKDKLWLTGSSQGSPAVAVRRFEHRAALTVGLLAVCGALLYKGAIWRSHVRLASSPATKAAWSTLCWERGGAEPHLINSGEGRQDLPLNAESMAYLRRVCFLDRIVALLDEEERTEVQDAIVRALYWFGDAHGDRNPIMRFIKLWTCVECFFAIDDTDITEANARGIATLLTFVGYSIVEPKDYLKFKRRLKSLYGLRSKAIHRAEFDLVENADLEEFSHWVAWMIVSMVALAERGYRTLAAVKEQVLRLDAITARTAATD